MQILLTESCATKTTLFAIVKICKHLVPTVETFEEIFVHKSNSPPFSGPTSTMCRTGSPQDFHGIGVTSVAFGLFCVLLPIHAMYERNAAEAGLYKHATTRDILTTISGVIFTSMGVGALSFSRRWLAKLDVHISKQILLVLAIFSLPASIVMFPMNYTSVDLGPLLRDKHVLVHLFVTANGSEIPFPKFQSHHELVAFTSLFSYSISHQVYRFAINVSFLVIISTAEFFLSLTVIIFICKTRNFGCWRFGSGCQEEFEDGYVPQYDSLEGSAGIVTIRPLPTKISQRNVNQTGSA